MCVPLPQNSCVEILTPKGDGISTDKAFGRYLSHENRALMDGTNAFIKGAPEESPDLSIMSGHSEKEPSMNQEEGLHQKATMLAPSCWSSLP